MGCPFCDINNVSIHLDNVITDTEPLGIVGDKQIILDGINYCPMCGRKLTISNN